MMYMIPEWARSLGREIRHRAQFHIMRRYGIGGRKRKTLREIDHNRRLFAARFLRGDGIEIGALNRPQPLPPRVRVKYVDRYAGDSLRQNYREMGADEILLPDIADNAEELATFRDSSLDFIIVNHVVEHLENPIKFFHSAVRVLRTGGVIFMALPARLVTFDRERENTTLDHLDRDFHEGPEWSRLDHFREFAAKCLTQPDIGGLVWESEEECETEAQRLLREDYSIHFHCWDVPAMMEMVAALHMRYGLPLETAAMATAGNEALFVLEKKYPTVRIPQKVEPRRPRA